MLDIPFELVSCSWPRPVARRGERWVSEPEWNAPVMPYAPEPRWRNVGGELCWTIDWREWFTRGLGLHPSSPGGQMRGFHVVFRLRVRRGGRLVFWDDDGSIVRRAGRVIHRDTGAHGPARHEIEVAEGDELEVAQWQQQDGWLWGARAAPGADEAEAAPAEALAPYLDSVRRRLLRPEGPPLKLYTSGTCPVRAIVCLYSLVLNGYAPSKVLLYGDYQWPAASRELFAELLPFAEVVPTESVKTRLQQLGGQSLAQMALRHWFVMKTFVALLCPPEEFCLMDDDVFVLGRMDDALGAFREHDLVYTPDIEHGGEYLKRWGWLHGRLREPLPTATFNAGLYLMRHRLDPRLVVRQALRVRPQYCEPYVWEQGYIANLFACAGTFQLPTQRYLFPLLDGLPGGPLGYDYAQNPCGFASVHFAGLGEKPSDAATLLLLPGVLDRGRRDEESEPPPTAPDNDATPALVAEVNTPSVNPPPSSLPPPPNPSAATTQGIVESRSPLVSCIMPTADRREYVPQAIRYFQRQDYPNLELLIVDDGADSVADCVPEDARVRYLRLPEKLNIGAKRNLACEHARGEFIVHWDDDDWYPPWRVSAQVSALDAGDFELCGTSRLFYFEPSTRRAWRYKYSSAGRSWVAGNTLAYRKSFWERRKFPALRVGEDTRFVTSAPAQKVCDLDDPRLCAATVHAANSSRKVTTGACWQTEPTETLRELLGGDFDFYLAPDGGASGRRDLPLVSCIMPTGDRRPFVRLALEHFARQDYPRKELIVVDDGADSVGDVLEGKPGVTYVRLPRRTSIGAKRNLACARARGEIIAHWDDDDWYAPTRLRYQAGPILAGEADLTGLSNSFVMVLPGGEFWTTLRPLHARMFTGDIHGGTLVYRKSLFEEGLRYPASNLAEDAALIRRAVARGHRLLRLDNAGEFVYVRHGRNAWREFSPGHFLDPAGWERTEAPQTFPAEALRAYQSASAALRP